MSQRYEIGIFHWCPGKLKTNNCRCLRRMKTCIYDKILRFEFLLVMYFNFALLRNRSCLFCTLVMYFLSCFEIKQNESKYSSVDFKIVLYFINIFSSLVIYDRFFISLICIPNINYYISNIYSMYHLYFKYIDKNQTSTT